MVASNREIGRKDRTTSVASVAVPADRGMLCSSVLYCIPPTTELVPICAAIARAAFEQRHPNVPLSLIFCPRPRSH